MSAKKQEVQAAQDGAALRPIRSVSERDIAMALVLEYAESNMFSFSLLGFYDNDASFISDLAERLRVTDDKAYRNKLRKVVRHLVTYGVLSSRMAGTQKEYIGEPAKQTDYALKPGKAALIRKGKTDHTMEPEDEAAYLLRRAYPEPQR